MAAFPTGRFSVISGLRSGIISAGFNPAKMLVDNRSITGFDIGGRFKARPEFLKSDLAEIFSLYEAGHLRPEVSGRFSIDQIVQAHKKLRASAVTGKLALVPKSVRACAHKQPRRQKIVAMPNVWFCSLSGSLNRLNIR